MKKIIGIFMAFALLITLLPFQQAEAAAVNKHYTVSVDTKLNVREKPSPKAKIVGSLKNGTVVFVYNTEPGGWSKIKYNGKAGYVSSNYLVNEVTELKKIKEYATKGTTEATKLIKVGETESNVSKKYGKPSSYNIYKDLEIRGYNRNPNFFILFPTIYDVKADKYKVAKNTKVFSIQSKFINKKTYTYAQIKSVFGEADAQTYSSYDDRYSISYEVGNYSLFFTQSDWKELNHRLKDSDKFNLITVVDLY